MTTKSESTIAIALVVVMLITVPASVVAQSTSVDASGPSSPKEPGDDACRNGYQHHNHQRNCDRGFTFCRHQ